MIWNVSSVVGSAAVSGDAARPGAEGIVSRPRLVGRLRASARVSVVSAPPGSGKTVLLRSWISQAGAPSCAARVLVGRAEHDPQPSALGKAAMSNQPRTQASYRPTLLRPGAFTVQIRRPATDEDQQQERPRNR